MDLVKIPDPPILAFFDFLAHFVFRFPLLFLCVFPFFSKDLRGSAKRKTLAFFGVSHAFFSKKKEGLEGQGSGLKLLDPLLSRPHLPGADKPFRSHRGLQG